MGWTKGKKRGPSANAGKQVLAVDPKRVAAILDDQTEPPEVRFVAVMEMMMPAMVASCNSNLAIIGMRLTAFWNDDMETTVMYTPVQAGMDLTKPPGAARVLDDGEEGDLGEGD